MSAGGLKRVRRGASFEEKVATALDWMGFEGMGGAAQEMAERDRYNLH